MNKDKDLTGVPASPSGCEASPSAAKEASSQSRIPNVGNLSSRLHEIAGYTDILLSQDSRRALLDAADLIKWTKGAGVCAYDRDECTVTLALDNEADVRALVVALPSKNRVLVCPDTETGCADDQLFADVPTETLRRQLPVTAASAMSAGTAETQSGSGLQPASAAPEGGDAP